MHEDEYCLIRRKLEDSVLECIEEFEYRSAKDIIDLMEELDETYKRIREGKIGGKRKEGKKEAD